MRVHKYTCTPRFPLVIFILILSHTRTHQNIYLYVLFVGLLLLPCSFVKTSHVPYGRLSAIYNNYLLQQETGTQQNKKLHGNVVLSAVHFCYQQKKKLHSNFDLLRKYIEQYIDQFCLPE